MTELRPALHIPSNSHYLTGIKDLSATDLLSSSGRATLFPAGSLFSRTGPMPILHRCVMKEKGLYCMSRLLAGLGFGFITRNSPNSSYTQRLSMEILCCTCFGVFAKIKSAEPI